MVKCFVLQIFCPLCFRYRYFPNRRGGVAGFGVPPTRRPAAQRMGGGGGGGRHNWGQGYHLGTEWEKRGATATRNKQACGWCFWLKCLFSPILSRLTEAFVEILIEMFNFKSCNGKLFEEIHFIWSKTARWGWGSVSRPNTPTKCGCAVAAARGFGQIKRPEDAFSWWWLFFLLFFFIFDILPHFQTLPLACHDQRCCSCTPARFAPPSPRHDQITL